MKGYINKVHTIHSSASQLYHAFRFQKNPYNGLKMKHLPSWRLNLASINTTFQEYEATERQHHNEFFTMHNTLIKISSNKKNILVI